MHAELRRARYNGKSNTSPECVVAGNLEPSTAAQLKTWTVSSAIWNARDKKLATMQFIFWRNSRKTVSTYPCIQLVRGNFELTKQDSEYGKNFTVLTLCKLTGKALKIVKRQKYETHLIFCLQAPNLVLKMGLWQLARSLSSVAK